MRYIAFIVFGALAVLTIIFWHLNPLKALVLLALGAIISSNAENEVGYNLFDWLKDRLIAFFGWAQSYSHAKLGRLQALAAKVQAKIMAEEQNVANQVKRGFR